MVDFTDLWRKFNWTLFEWAISPKRVIFLLLPIIVVTFVRKTPRWATNLGRVLAIVLIIYIVLALPPTASWLVGSLANQLPKPDSQLLNSDNQFADEIVVLTRDKAFGMDRYHLAVRLWERDRAPRIFVTDFERLKDVARIFLEKDFPLEALGGTYCGRTTYEEAISTSSILTDRGITRIILITDPPHMLRSHLTFKAFGFSVVPKIASFPSSVPPIHQSLISIREYIGLASYAILGRFRPKGMPVKEPDGNSLSIENCSIKEIPY